MKYGDKRSYAKIDFYLDGIYCYSTTWAKDLKTAKQNFNIGNFSHKSIYGKNAKLTAHYA